MKKRQWMLLSTSLWGIALHAQVEQLATSGDGRVLLLHSHFRLQSELGLGSQGKIYRWQDGVWTRVATAQDISFAISPPDVSGPFLSTDGSVMGWQINVGCVLCQLIITPPFSSEVSGISLPVEFPRGTLRMSANGRYFTADNYPFRGAKYLDGETGAIADIPVDFYVRPVVREVANDGTALLLITSPNDPSQFQSPGTLTLWKPGADSQPIYSDTRVLDPTISAAGSQVAFETVVDGGPDDDRRTLVVLDTKTGERIPIAAMPSSDYRATVESFSKPVWDGNGTRLLYRSFDNYLPGAISLWDAGSRTSRTLITSSEGFSSAVISGDGNIVWAATSANRLLRLNLSTGVIDEILPPLGSVTRAVDGDGVPGSAVLIHGIGFSKTQMAFDARLQLPVAGAESDGLWVQIPWEYAATLPATHKLLIRSGNNPFEAVVNVSITPRVEPHIATSNDSTNGVAFAKAIHQDFQSLVSPSSPARPGETVHVYLTGLGPLDQPIATGVPGPAEPQLHPVTPLLCRLGNNPPQPLQMPYLGYAAGLIGIYQADLTIPGDAPEDNPTLYCSAPPDGSGNVSTGAALLSTTSVR